jgi:hypothetical protein
MTLPLAKLKVIDVSQVMAGPFCCMLLGDMGADVIKVEPPGVGDQTRRAMGFRLKGNHSGGFLALNRNKRSVELNLKNAAGREAFYQLGYLCAYRRRVRRGARKAHGDACRPTVAQCADYDARQQASDRARVTGGAARCRRSPAGMLRQ